MLSTCRSTDDSIPASNPQPIPTKSEISSTRYKNKKNETKVTGPGVAAVVGQGDRRSVAVVRIYLGVSVKGLE
jgi:hypothetical protein